MPSIPRNSKEGKSNEQIQITTESQDTVETPRASSPVYEDEHFRRVIEELCGLGAISPFSRDKSQWEGAVRFSNDHKSVKICQSLTTEDAVNFPNTLSRLIRVAERLCTAAHMSQTARLCCSSFTYLLSGHSDVSRQVKLDRVNFSSGVRLLFALKSLKNMDWGRAKAPGSIVFHTLEQVFKGFPIILAHLRDKCTTEEVLNLSSLALQFLCLAFLSYSQAHVGGIKTFFLDTPIQDIALGGLEYPSPAGISIRAYLVELSCLAGMVQGPVLVFQDWHPFYGPSPRFGQSLWAYDVRASPEDVLDTWGPGEILTSRDNESPVAIKLGGGYIYPVSGGVRTKDHHYHWARDLKLPKSIPSMSLSEEIVIGAFIEADIACDNNERQCWRETCSKFEELGTHRSYPERTENQAGVQVGLDSFNLTGNRVWKKRRGKTVKEKILESSDASLVGYLDSYWGLQISFCTGVAQRVMLRELVADVLPAFMKARTRVNDQRQWADLQNNAIIEALAGRNPNAQSLIDWLCHLPKDLNVFFYSQVHAILEKLGPTGMGPTGKYFSIAWPFEGIVHRCLQVPVDGYNKWTEMLADSHDCATFAYISNKCLQTDLRRCRGPNPTWEDRIHLLETAMICPTGPQNWSLCHERKYYFQKLDDNLFWVKAQKDIGKKDAPARLVRLISIKSFPEISGTD